MWFPRAERFRGLIINISPDGVSGGEEGAAHFTEFFDFSEESFLRDFEMIGQAGKAQESFRAAVDHFFREGFFVRNEGAAAAGAALMGARGRRGSG